MSLSKTLAKLIKSFENIIKEDGFTDKDVNETFEYAKKVVSKSNFPDNIKSVVLNALDKREKDKSQSIKKDDKQ